MPADTTVTRPNYVSIVGFGVLIVAFLGLGVWPCYRSYTVVKQDIADRKQQLADIQAQAVQLKESNNQISLLALQVKDYPRLVPENQDLGTFLEQLSRELSASGIKDASTRALPPAMLGKCQQLPIEIRGIGTAFSCYDFLARLERLPRMSSVSQLSMETDAALSGQVTMQLTVSIYSSARTN